MPPGRHGVSSYERVSIRCLVGRFGNSCRASPSSKHASAAGQLGTGIGDQCHFTLACPNCRYCVVEVCLEGGAANSGSITVTGKYLQVFAKHDGRHTQSMRAAENPIDIILTQSTLLQRAPGSL